MDPSGSAMGVLILGGHDCDFGLLSGHADGVDRLKWNEEEAGCKCVKTVADDWKLGENPWKGSTGLYTALASSLQREWREHEQRLFLGGGAQACLLTLNSCASTPYSVDYLSCQQFRFGSHVQSGSQKPVELVKCDRSSQDS